MRGPSKPESKDCNDCVNVELTKVRSFDSLSRSSLRGKFAIFMVERSCSTNAWPRTQSSLIASQESVFFRVLHAEVFPSRSRRIIFPLVLVIIQRIYFQFQNSTLARSALTHSHVRFLVRVRQTHRTSTCRSSQNISFKTSGSLLISNTSNTKASTRCKQSSFP